MLVARVLIAFIFIWAGLGKFLAWDASVAFMAKKSMPFIPYFLFLAACIEFFCGMAIVLGFKTCLAAIILILYLIPVTFIFHDFWNLVDDSERLAQLIHFLSNISIMGGLLSLVIGGPGNWAIDRKYVRQENDCCK